MKDNFNLKKFLTENKTIENSNPYLKENQKDMADDKKSSLREKVREMIINELGGSTYEEEDEIFPSLKNHPNTYDSEDEPNIPITAEEGIEEAKKDEEEEEPRDGVKSAAAKLGMKPSHIKEEEEEEEEEEEGDKEEEIDVEAEETETETGGGIEDIAADMDGNEGDLMDHLISALKVSKSMDNDKLTTQIGNTLKFFVGEYIGGEE